MFSSGVGGNGEMSEGVPRRVRAHVREAEEGD